MPTKDSLRKEMKVRLSAQSAAEREAKSFKIQKKLFAFPAFQNAGSVWFYAALPSEVDTLPMIQAALQAGKKVLVPLTDLENKELSLFEIKDLKKDLRPGTLGIPEPRPEVARSARFEEADCVVVPGLVFDKAGHRIGHGAGFYDKSLAALLPRVPKIGLAFSFQVLQEIPQENHDQVLDTVLTD